MSKELLIIRYGDLAKELGVSRCTIWRWKQKNILPSAISLGPKIICWERSVINEWLKSKRVEGV
jgi:predicted DNA-binding transcriptional regulator AlpA